MGRKLDLSGLTDSEAEHVLQVVQRDMKLRKTEEDRLSELKQQLVEEGSRCLLLSRQSCFNRRCCIRCCTPFTFLLNPKRQCQDCLYNVCKACRIYSKRDKSWLCTSCQKSRLLKTQSLEWFYTNVKRRFKRFGSAKVLKTLYKKHLVHHSGLSELTEGSAFEDSIYNEGSVSETDSTFYKQTEDHSMAETLSVALRVAEEAIDEAISNAEIHLACQEKQNEAHYLREHRGELIKELAKTIIQKIITRRKTLGEMNEEDDEDWTHKRNTDVHHRSGTEASRSLKLWRSHSASSLLDKELPALIKQTQQARKIKDDGLDTWKSVDRLDNSGVSSVLKSPDGNWLALQSSQLSRPSLLTKRKSLVYSALERESGVVSAYEGMDSDNENQPDERSWGAVLQEIHRKMTDSKFHIQDHQDEISAELVSVSDDGENLYSDSEGNRKHKNPQLAVFKRKVPAEIRRPSSSSRRTNIIDVNFNVKGAGEKSTAVPDTEVGKFKRSRKRRKSKKRSSPEHDHMKIDQFQHSSDAATPDTLTSGVITPELLNLGDDITGHGAHQIDQELTSKLVQLAGRLSDPSARDNEPHEMKDADFDKAESEEGRNKNTVGEQYDERIGTDMAGSRTEDENEEEEDQIDEEMKNRLYRLVAQSRLTYFSSTDDDLDKASQLEGEWDRELDETEEEEFKEERERSTEGLTYHLCQLENEVRATLFSSTEDELDRIVDDDIEAEEEKGGERDEELAVKVCKLANQVNATNFSSTEDELDRVGEEKDKMTDKETLWKLQDEDAAQTTGVHHLANLVNVFQFSSDEDEPQTFRENEGLLKHDLSQEEVRWDMGVSKDRRESIGDLDVTMFDLRDGSCEIIKESCLEKEAEVPIKNNQVGQMEWRIQKGKASTIENEDKRIAESISTSTGTKQKMLMAIVNAETKEEQAEEIIAGQQNQPKAKWFVKGKREERWEEDMITESGHRKEEWELASDSDDEDAEFNKIISSMLMMTLEDMQVETPKTETANDQGIRGELEEAKVDNGVNMDSNTEETIRAHESQSQGETRNQESDACSGEIVAEAIAEYIFREGELVDEDGQRGNANNLKECSLAKDRTMVTLSEETNEAKKKHAIVKKENSEEKLTMALQNETREINVKGESENEEMDEKPEETEGKHANDMERSSTSSPQQGLLSPEEIQSRYSAASLRSITTEVLRVLNATEELMQGIEGGDTSPLANTLPHNIDLKKLDQQFSRLEENVYVAAGTVYHLEAELSDLEESARGICSKTSDMELSFLEDQVASAAAKVQHSELKVSDISARIAALKSAGLNVDPQSRLSKFRAYPVTPLTLDSSRQLRRRLPAPPLKDIVSSITEDKDT